MYIKEGKSLSRKTKVWLKNPRHVWQSPTEMLFQKLPINALDAHLKTCKDFIEDVMKVNQMMSYTECRFSHCPLTHDKKRLVEVGIKHTTPRTWEKGAST